MTTIHTLTTLLHNYGGARLIINGKKCSMNSVRTYTLYNNITYNENKDLDEAEAREMKKPGAQLYWINLESTVLCGDPGYYEKEKARWANVPQVQAGDIVVFEGKQFVIKPTFNGNFNPIPVA